MDGHCIAVGTRWAALYFYAFYFVAVLLVVNIVVAFLIDDFVVTQGVVLESRQNKVAAWYCQNSRTLCRDATEDGAAAVTTMCFAVLVRGPSQEEALARSRA